MEQIEFVFVALLVQLQISTLHETDRFNNFFQIIKNETNHEEILSPFFQTVSDHAKQVSRTHQLQCVRSSSRP